LGLGEESGVLSVPASGLLKCRNRREVLRRMLATRERRRPGDLELCSSAGGRGGDVIGLDIVFLLEEAG